MSPAGLPLSRDEDMAAEGAGIGVFGASIARQCLERGRLDEIVALGAGPDH